MWRKSRRFSTSFAAFALIGLLAAPSGAAATAGAGAENPSARLARSVLKSEDCQTEMPKVQAEEPPFFLFWLGRYVIWIVLALIGVSLLLLAWWLYQEFGRGIEGGGISSQVAEGPGKGGKSRTVELADAERWAALGNYREAAHVLLLVAIQRLIEPLPVRPDLSRTSRELLHLLPLTPPRRQAFGRLVGRVEIAVFGDQAVDSEQYAACRASFEALFAGRQT